VWDALIEPAHRISVTAPLARPIGWHAFNIARIEAGTPLFNIDFGPTNLPHETGLLSHRVSFTKGCYLGQEVVARLENLGKPKQILVGLKVQTDALPIAGAQVFEQNSDNSMGDQIGVVTSSTLSPMLGAVPIAFAMLKTTKATPGATVLVSAEGEQAPALISPLRFWPREVDARS
jgi:folate-binding protein YgfZ